jgi:VanZ family protein
MIRVLLALYLVFLVYGSFFPFDLTTDPAVIRENLALAVLAPYDADGHRVFSLADLASNIILGAPFGFLIVAAGLTGRGTSAAGRLAAAGLLDLFLASAIEAGQLLAPGRVASALDVTGQVVGSLAGALAGHVALLIGFGGLSLGLAGLLRRRPLLAPLVVLLGVLAADALYPYGVTLDPSTVWHGIKQSRWDPRAIADAQPWDALVMDRVLPYAVVAALARESLVIGSRARLVALWIATVGVAGGLEVGKLFIEGRTLALGHVLLAGAGALPGLALGPRALTLARGSWRRAAPVLGAVVMAYHELRPFDLTPARDVIRTNVARVEWIPFATYLLADPQTALADAGKKLLLGALFGVLMQLADGPAPGLWGAALAALLEAAQLLSHSHQAALTDVALLAGGAWLGSALLARYRLVLDFPVTGGLHRS